jgi:hypothetical protein
VYSITIHIIPGHPAGTCPLTIARPLIIFVFQVISRYADAIQHSYREVLKASKSNIAVHQALHRQLAELDEGMLHMQELMDQKCQTMMSSLPRNV